MAENTQEQDEFVSWKNIDLTEAKRRGYLSPEQMSLSNSVNPINQNISVDPVTADQENVTSERAWNRANQEARKDKQIPDLPDAGVPAC